jgi:uncharacterized protein YbbK (DUF523 family)
MPTAVPSSSRTRNRSWPSAGTPSGNNVPNCSLAIRRAVSGRSPESDPLLDVLLDLPFNELGDLFVIERSQVCGHNSNLGFQMPQFAGPRASRGPVSRQNGDVFGFSHLPSGPEIAAWPSFTREHPLELLVSACLRGVPCGVDGTSYGAPYSHADRLLRLPNVHVVAFCPEDFAFGTPRATPDIHGGTGFDVLDGAARVVNDAGEDWTTQMLDAAQAMLRVAQENGVRLALLMDISAACGSQVIYDGPRSEGRHQAGQGVCAALLIRHGIRVVSQRDHRTLDAVLSKLDSTHQADPTARDHHETPW